MAEDGERRGEMWTQQREMLLRYYVAHGFNATKAARLAGYTHPNSRGPEVVHTEVFQRHLQAYLASTDMSREEILARMVRAARTPAAAFYEPDPDDPSAARINWNEALDGEHADAIQSVRQTAGGKQSLVLLDRLKALEMLARARGMLVDRSITESADAALSNDALSAAAERLRAYRTEHEAAAAAWQAQDGPSEEQPQ